MGQVCSGDKPEASKSGAIDDVSDQALLSEEEQHQLHLQQQQQQQSQQQQQQQSASAQSALAAEDVANGERLKALREEQARLDLIVATAGRGMVAVRSTRGSTGYYDQGFAAALAQHLEQTTQFPDELAIRLPPSLPPSSSSSSGGVAKTGGGGVGGSGGPGEHDEGDVNDNSSSVYNRLSQPLWENICLGTKGTGLAGCAGENPNTYMDHVAESLLDTVVPGKQQLFAGVNPMIENLL